MLLERIMYRGHMVFGGKVLEQVALSSALFRAGVGNL